MFTEAEILFQTTARILPPPKVEFQGSVVAPGTSGRWDLRGPRKFLIGNTQPLQSWGVCICQELVLPSARLIRESS